MHIHHNIDYKAVVQHCGIFERSDWVRIYSSVWLNCLNVKRALTNYYRQPKIIGRRFKANQFTHSRIYGDKLPTVSNQNRNSDIDKGLNTNILLFAAFGWLVKFKHVRASLCWKWVLVDLRMVPGHCQTGSGVSCWVHFQNWEQSWRIHPVHLNSPPEIEMVKSGHKIHSNYQIIQGRICKHFLRGQPLGYCYRIAVTAYRIHLTLPISIAAGEHSFLKLKLVKNYLGNRRL